MGHGLFGGLKNIEMIIKSPNEVWRLIVFAPFLIIIIIILLLLSFFCQKFIRHISLRLLNGNQWNFTGMLSTMSRCADYFRNFQNGHHCHIFASQWLRFGSPFSPPLADLEYILKFARNATWWFIEVAPLR